jgi:hypothetical protein
MAGRWEEVIHTHGGKGEAKKRSRVRPTRPVSSESTDSLYSFLFPCLLLVPPPPSYISELPPPLRLRRVSSLTLRAREEWGVLWFSSWAGHECIPTIVSTHPCDRTKKPPAAIAPTARNPTIVEGRDRRGKSGWWKGDVEGGMGR